MILVGCAKNIQPTITSEQTAIEIIKNTYTELKDYPSDNLPPRSISTQQNDNGWYVAFIQEGSGRPIISARCFFVDINNNIINNGEYVPTLADDSVQKFSAKTCTSNPPSEVISNPIKACTEEAKLCPDGSAVGRSGPYCEFTPCPEETITTCINSCTCPTWYRQEGEGCTPECYYSTPKCLMPSIKCESKNSCDKK